MRVNNTIVKPIITEKSSRLSKSNVYAFEVHMNADKNKVSEVIKTLYGVEVDSVRIITRKGKEKRIGRTYKTKMLPNKKIAYVYVTKGTIELFPKA